jgi:TonB family protein
MSKPESWKSWQGRVVAEKFLLRQYLGGSDHSAVYATETPAPQSARAAIKLMNLTSTGASPADLDRELSRLRAALSLSHPHLIRTIEAGRCQIESSPFLYLVMEQADDDLSQILPQRALEPSEVGDLLPPLIDALSYLHSRGFIHSRIKPSNVLAVGEQLKLSADNIHAAANPNSTRRRADAYDAPETAAGISSPEGDLWSVGAILIAALTQNVALVEDGVRTGSGLPQNIPDPYRGIARECLRLDPKQRCSLAEIQARLHPSARSVPAEPELAFTPGSHFRFSWRTAIPAAVLCLLALVWGLYRVISRPSPEKAAESQTQPPPAASEPSPPQSLSAPPPRASAQPENPPRATAPPNKPTTSEGTVVHQVLPEVPKSAMHTISGTIKVVVRVQVDPSGRVSSASFKSTGSSRYFANLAMKAAEQWEFSAPLVNDRPTASTWLLQFRFKRSSTQATPQRVKG